MTPDITAQTFKNHAPEASAPPESPAPGVGLSAAETSGDSRAPLPSPLPAAESGLPAHLEQLADRDLAETEDEL